MGRYVCLSYCWGKSEFVMTTTETLESHRRGIAITSLPQTFQDAIRVCQALGVQYLWIDALCIIQKQEDNDDWKKESVQMSDIYRNSYLTIAAVSSNSVHGGCFNRPEDGVRNGPVMMRHIKHFPNNPFSEQNPDFPLLERAWAYQERMLSPRTLYFGRQELLWDCQSHRACECGRALHLRDEVRQGAFNAMVSECQRDFPVALQKLWRQIVVQYSSLQLSFCADKLPALSGLADDLQRKTGQKYLAGLWRESFIADMCWYTELEDTGQAETQTWRAPTWSWASMDVPITYSQYFYLDGHDIGKDFDLHATLLDAQCTLGGPSQTGPVTGGFVDLGCAKIPVSFKAGRVHTGSWDLNWYSDGKYKIEEAGEYYFIPLITVKRSLEGLVVTPKDKYFQEMVRIGLASGWEPEQFSIGKVSKVRII